MVTAAMKLKDAYSLGKKKNYDQPRQYIKKQRHYFANNGLTSQSFGFSSSDVRVGPNQVRSEEEATIDTTEIQRII